MTEDLPVCPRDERHGAMVEDRGMYLCERCKHRQHIPVPGV